VRAVTPNTNANNSTNTKNNAKTRKKYKRIKQNITNKIITHLQDKNIIVKRNEC